MKVTEKTKIGIIILIGLMLLLMATLLRECSKETNNIISRTNNNTPRPTFIPIETEDKSTKEPSPSPTPTQEPSPTPVIKGEPGAEYSKHPDYYGKKVVCLTFDDGPSGVITDKLLDGLKERGVKATFFVTSLGENDKDWDSDKRILNRLKNEGHEIANHTKNHNYGFKEMTGEKIREELGFINETVVEMTGYLPRLFRPPGGSYNQKVLDESHMTLIDYSKDTRDWYYFNDGYLLEYSTEHEISVDEARTVLVQYVLDCLMGREYDKNISWGKIGHGTIFLFHDNYQGTVEVALALIDELIEDDFVFLTVTDAIESEGGEVLPGQHYKFIWEGYKTRIERQEQVES